MEASSSAPKKQISPQYLANRSRRRRRRLIALAAVLAVGGGSHYWMKQQAARIDEDQYFVATIGYGYIENAVAAAGRIWPRELVPVGVRESGELVEIYVEVGDEVEEGQPLALIDSREQLLRLQSSQQSVESLRNQVPQAELSLEIAENDLRRTRTQLEANASTARALERAEENLQRARTNLDRLMNRIQRSEANLGQDEVQLNYTEIRAPLSGTIVSLDQKKGATLNASRTAPTIMQIADLTSMVLEAEISEADMSVLEEGADVYFTTAAGGDRRWYATLNRIVAQPPTRRSVATFTGRIDLDNSNGEFFPGMSAQVFFVTSFVDNVLIVPVAALSFAETPDGARNATARVVLPNGTAEDREVVIGLVDRVYAEVVSGLEEGERVIAGLGSP